jgi:hypothetical protein
MRVGKTNNMRIAPCDFQLETMCKYLDSCKTKNCGFNHIQIENKCIKKGEVIPDSLCINEFPWDRRRCSDIFCKKNHCYGRVRFMIKSNTQFELDSCRQSIRDGQKIPYYTRDYRDYRDDHDRHERDYDYRRDYDHHNSMYLYGQYHEYENERKRKMPY